MSGTYYPSGCCPAASPPGEPLAELTDILACSHAFTGQRTITLATLLGQSGYGNAAVHTVDIDVRSAMTTVDLVRGGGIDPLQEGDSRSWAGAVDGATGEHRPANGFTLILATGDVVVINWTEILA